MNRLYAAVLPLVASLPMAAGSFKAADGGFLLNGEPFVVKAAELHYPRIPRPYWEQRIRMCKALGMNTICLYTFWNAHEPEKGEFDFEGNNDLTEFIRLCRDNGMYVILRPGPYVCAEWEMGGLPWWLLKDKDIRLRESDPRFLEAVDRFQKEVADRVGGLTIADDGPIIMIQVENEYGSYGKAKEYVGRIRDMLRHHFGDDVTMFQCDWSSNFLDNGLDDLVWTLNFGTGADIDAQFAPLREARPDSPLMCSEFWSGWFDKWGAGHETRPADAMIAGIDEMLSKDISFSLYMTHGGTNWGHWAGANSPGYAPDVTSYDYDAPIDEQGAPTEKYHLLRETMRKYSDKELPDIPAVPPTMEMAAFRLDSVAPLFSNLPEAVRDSTLRTMEEYGFGYGSILYSTTVPPSQTATRLTIRDVHDYARIFLDGVPAGSIDRRLGEDSVLLPPHASDARLDILVESMGRINFGRAIKDFKGIVGEVSVSNPDNGAVFIPSGWEVHPLPDTPALYESMRGREAVGDTCTGTRIPGLYTATFNPGDTADTWLDMSGWGKGLVYVNGHGLGRFWEIGPQQTLYLPGCWLREGENEIMVFDIIGPSTPTIAGLKRPVLDSLSMPDKASERIQSASAALKSVLAAAEPAYRGSLAEGAGWQSVRFPEPVRGRYLVIEMLSSRNGSEAAVAELHLTDRNGNRIAREDWKTILVDSEQTSGNHTADKAYDLQESTYWQSAPDSEWPHIMVIDLGGDYDAAGLEYLPRMESGSPGAIKDIRITILSNNPIP